MRPKGDIILKESELETLKCVYYLGTLNARSQWCNRPLMNGGQGDMTLGQVENIQDLDMEWVELILSARKMGFNTEEIRKALLCIKEESKADMQDKAV